MNQFKLEPWPQDITDEDIITDLRNIAKSIGSEYLTVKQYEEFGRFDPATAKLRFGTWNKALTRAGLKISHRNSLPRAELFENLERVWMALGRQPRMHEMRKPMSLFSGDVYKKRFGSWRSALETFVKTVDSSPAEIDNYQETDIQRHRTPRNPSLRLKFKVMRRDNFKCKLCGASPALKPGLVLHIDHIKPWIIGGETVMNNLETLCEQCNIGKSDLPMEEE
ncbi:MAG TPA: HNH endonuclease [Nitrospirae bacterium]|nr:HNH endonuclease [Nitrospirota bacterium]